jgi:hypothetical protein
MATITVKEVIEMSRKVGHEWWLTPHVIYTLTDDYGNVIDGRVTVREPLAPSGVKSEWLPEDVSKWSQHLNECFADINVPQSVLDQYYWQRAIDDIVSELVSMYWNSGPDVVLSHAY